MKDIDNLASMRLLVKSYLAKNLIYLMQYRNIMINTY